jgi:chromate transporter
MSLTSSPPSPEPAGPVPAAEPLRRPADLGELFLVFTRLALQGFGGVLAVAQRELVERQRWMDKAQFLETFAAAQVLPGPNVVNLSLMVGDRFFGTRGAIVALTGMLAAPTFIVLLAVVLYRGFSTTPAVAGALRGMGAVSAGLIAATAFKLAGGLRRSPLGRPAVTVLALVTVLLVAAWRLPMAVVVPGLGLPAFAWAWWRAGR